MERLFKVYATLPAMVVSSLLTQFQTIRTTGEKFLGPAIFKTRIGGEF
jgi:hypothetical protein